jgi:hypothetical protein
MDPGYVLTIKQWLEFLGGERDTADETRTIPPTSCFWGIWWGILLILIYVFCGQTSKFIYIDF